jgi:hypothetical protein
MKIEVSIGEALDKLSILSIKMDKIKDPTKLENISKEYFRLIHPIEERMLIDPLYKDLKSINEKLWNIEDDIRQCEKYGDFNLNFIRLARMVYHNNDKRAEIKKEINIKYGSDLIEEKEYQSY